MAEWIIEEFSVRNRGESSRWARVWVDENGNCRTDTPPGKNAINQTCVSNYRYEGRNYNPGDVITTFCNFQTFTKYTIKAQDCRPYAYAESVLNSPECGYLEPLPKPATPPNPFGSVPYKVYRFFRYKTAPYPELNINEEKILRVNIKKRNYNGPAFEIELPTGTG